MTVYNCTPKLVCGNFEKRLSEISGEIIDFEIPLQIPHPCFSIVFRREIYHFRSHHPTEKERFGKNRTSLHFRKNSIFTRVSYLLKYLFKRPSKALPWRASSRAISCTVSCMASRLALMLIHAALFENASYRGTYPLSFFLRAS